ncbi:branched-chain amino acid ABC transporter permease [Siccirubricoccus sp. KC 17139]|uniref:Branched-chain amino acid ABC transporter permease n=1 Tax=Siccirubricoccus soli TaxID=2899147 RepID=A0ABT1D3R6_9PROT|nr:branched-chain amino acid ABC transporter permease [Siccirubricoccus soli]MCO6416562.1 branched-chain amino acid ABC transporter permease [Siccirubricoccus soli]MCP2682697.1 branched-chain amino acid ABC transporter permease [Siccirubricoccus soli]
MTASVAETPMAAPPSRSRAIGVALGSLLLLVLPALATDRYLETATRGLIASLFALAFNLLWRHCRLLSFGHAAYFGAGMFATIHAMRAAEAGSLDLPLPLMPLMGLLAGAVLGLVCGALATIRTGTYFAMITLAISELVHSFGPQFGSLFGGESGLSAMRMPWAGFAFGDARQVYVLVLAWALAGAAALWLFGMTPLGRTAFAVGENETRLRFLGMRTHAVKTATFCASAAASGLAGALLAVANENVDYSIFGGGASAAPVMHTFIGGAGTFLGPVLGAVLLTGFGSIVGQATRLWLLYQGIFFVLVVMLAPGGLAGLVAAGLRRSADGQAAKALRATALVLAGALLVTCAVVFAGETLSEVLSDAYSAARATTGMRFPPVERLGLAYSPLSLPLWAAAAAAFLGGVLLLRRAMRP